jgi:hypothetical protein
MHLGAIDWSALGIQDNPVNRRLAYSGLGQLLRERWKSVDIRE